MFLAFQTFSVGVIDIYILLCIIPDNLLYSQILSALELCWSRGPRLLGRYLSSGSGDGRVRRHSPRVGRAQRNPPVQIETPRIPEKITFLQTQLFKILF